MTGRRMKIEVPPGFPSSQNATLVTRAIADIPIEPLRWLWPGRLPLGKLSLIVGDPGGGKTLLGCFIAATVSRGDRWPDDMRAEVGEVLIASAEDDPADTLRPRLEATGANLGRVRFVDGLRRRGDKILPWTLEDFASLDTYLAERPETRAVIIDPISAFMPIATDSYKNTEVRGALAPFATIAMARGVAVVGVTHLRKSKGQALHRVLDSLAFVAAALAVWLVGRDPQCAERRLFLSMKTNLAPAASGLAFHIEAVPVSIGAENVPTPRIAWEAGVVTMTADEALRPAKEHAGGEAMGRACTWLVEELRGGPQPAADLQARAKAAGLAWRTVKRAKAVLQVESVKKGKPGGWTWRTSGDSEGCQKAYNGNLGTLSTLSSNNETKDAKDATVPTLGKLASLGGAGLWRSTLP